ncbi:MAG: O-antigen ligase family protein [Lachnospiraceae bacterium]|nr:O-antigen ligase family protein [Lachnospiraceae bacterium]
MNVTTKNIQKNVGIILVGVIISMALSAMLLSGSKSFDVFYDGGAVYDEPKGVNNYLAGIVYDSADGKLKVINEMGYQGWNFPKGLQKYNYFIVKVNKLEKTGIPVVIRFYKNGYEVQTSVTNLKSGENVIQIYRKDANSIYMEVKQGAVYEFCGIQCREKLSLWDTEKFLAYGILFFLIYLMIVVIVQKVLKKNKIHISIYRMIEKLGKIYEKAAENMRICRLSVNKKTICILRRILFFCLFFLLNFEEKNRLFQPNWSRNVLIYSGILLVISFLSVEEKKEKRKLKWNTSLISAYFLLTVCMILSNFIIEKKFQNLGLILLLIFGFFYYVWSNMEDKTELIQDICVAIKWEFWLDIGRCFLFFPVLSSRYSGSFYNPNAYAINLMVPLAVFFSEIVESKEIGRKLSFKISSAFGVGMTIYMVWRTQCRTGLLGIILVFGFVIALCRKDKILRKKQERRVMLCLIFFSVLGIGVGQVGLIAFPKIVNEPQQAELVRKYEGNLEKESNIFVMEAQAAEIEKNRMLEKIYQARTLNDFSSGRIAIWKDYIRQMNLWGHAFRVESGGEFYAAHNGFLEIAYQYGVLSAVVYLYYIAYYIWYAFTYLREKRKKSQYAVFPFFLLVSAIPVLLIENLEEPFRFETWIVMYLVVGILFSKELEETENVELT